MSSVLDHSNYREYLDRKLSQKPGLKARLARALGCQNTYISRILKGQAHLSLDQAWMAAEHFALSDSETTYFLNLVQRERASHHRLKAHLTNQLEEARAKRKNITHRLQNEEVPAPAKAQYYSSWLYAAVHACTAIPSLQNRAAMRQRLGLPQKKLDQILEFLSTFGLIHQIGDRFTLGSSSLHLDQNSALIGQLHTNWRIQAIASLDKNPQQDLHYSVLMAISQQDAERIHRLLVDAIKNSNEIVKAAESETLRCLCVDLFEP